MYDSQELKQFKASILENIESLYDKTAQLKGEQCLSALIKYYGEDEEIIDSNVTIIKEYLEKNKNAGGIHIGFDEDVLAEELKGLCQKLVEMKTVTEKDLLWEATTKTKRDSQHRKTVASLSSSHLVRGAQQDPARRVT